MKRKILLISLMVLTLMLVFAIGALAAPYDENRTTIEYKDASGTVHSVPVVKIDGATPGSVIAGIAQDTSRGHMNSETALTAMQDNSAYVVLMADDNTLTAFPSWYIIDATSDNGGAVYEISYGYLNSEAVKAKTGKTYSEGAIRYIEFPSGMKALRNNGVFGAKNDAKPYETNVTDIVIPSSVTVIQSAFNSAKSLKNVYIMPNSQITQIQSGAFSNSTVEYVQFENLTELVSIDGFTKTALTCDLDLSNSKLVTIAGTAFQGNANLGRITLPDTVQTIGNAAFESCTNAYLASPYLPASLTYVGERFFSYNHNLNATYIFPEGVKALGNEPFQDSYVPGSKGNKLNLVFLGEVTGIVYLNGNGHQKHASEVTVYFAKNSLSDYNKNGFKIKPSGSSVTSVPRAIRAVFCEGTGAGTNGNVTGVEYIYITSTDGTSYTSDMVNAETNGFDFESHTHFGALVYTAPTCGTNGFDGVSCIVCDKQIGTTLLATGNHSYEDDKNCETAESCIVCKAEINSAGEHNLSIEIAYAKGITAQGERLESCTNEGCEHEIKISAQAIVEFLGYSAKQNGDSICVGYKINSEALIAYEEVTGNKVSLGAVAIIPINEAEKQPVYVENGEIKNIDYSVAVDVSTEYAGFDFRINGFTQEDYETPMVMCAYAVINGEVSYLCVSADGFGQYESASTITFNSKVTQEGEYVQ